MIKKLFLIFLFKISSLARRDKRKWVFGSQSLFSDNSRHLFLDKYNPLNIRKIWIAKNQEEFNKVFQLGFEVYKRGSIKAMYHCLTAKVYIYTCYVSDISYKFSGGAFCVNLWHGIPLKKIEFDILQGYIKKKFNNSLKSKIKYPDIYRKADLLLCPSPFVYDYSFKSAFKISRNNVVFTPYPRTIALKSQRKGKERKGKEFTFLYAPTWRDANSNFLNQNILDLNQIEKFCLHYNCAFKIKFHPNTKINLNLTNTTKIFLENNQIDPNISLAETDCLITDYSSIFLDYLVLDRPVIFYNFDEDEYTHLSREMYDISHKLVCGKKIISQEQLLVTMKNIIDGNDEYKDQRQDVRLLLGLDFDLRQNSTLYDTIAARAFK